MTPLFLLSRLKLWRCTRVGQRVEVLGSIYVIGGGHIEIGDDVILDGRLVPIELHAEPGAELIIGHGCVLEGGVSIEAQKRVEIGPGSRLRAFCKLMDNNFHPVLGSRHRRPPSHPVKLEAAVEVGERAIVLPGAWLEKKVTLGPGVVIARRVKAGATVLVPIARSAPAPSEVEPEGAVNKAPVKTRVLRPAARTVVQPPVVAS
ncbi:MAG: acetyltransferase [Archangium sp.]|nr:acetyltransferase [Archangium sp.]MDP3153788.1 acetyltransferase [Archangium sp.]MDP3569379.1 acetyltransferase [Archangium sp.]